MTATPQYAVAQPPPARGWGAGRVIALVCGILLLLPGLGLLFGGGALLWADRFSRTDSGYLFSGSETFASPGYALTSEQVDLTTAADWLPVSSTLGTARIDVTGTGSDADVFIGIAPVAEGRAYLDGVQRTVVNDIGSSGSGQVQRPGGAPSGPPGEQDFWVAQASGSGTQQLTWSPEQGNWMLVVMNADGSAGVSVQARIGATVPSLGGLAWGIIAAGAVLTVIGVVLVVLAVRRGSARSGGQPVPAGPPTAWAPPVPRAAPDATESAPTSSPPPPTSPPPPG